MIYFIKSFFFIFKFCCPKQWRHRKLLIYINKQINSKWTRTCERLELKTVTPFLCALSSTLLYQDWFNILGWNLMTFPEIYIATISYSIMLPTTWSRNSTFFQIDICCFLVVWVKTWYIINNIKWKLNRKNILFFPNIQKKEMHQWFVCTSLLIASKDWINKFTNLRYKVTR